MITHDYKLIYIHIPKCGGRSICDIFNQRFDHFTSMYYKNEYAHFWERYEKFSIVRNPYSRLVSMYHYIQQHRRHASEPIALNGAPFKEWVMVNLDANDGHFNVYSPEAERGLDWTTGSRFWFSSQVWFIDYKRGLTRLFQLEDGLDKVAEWLVEIGIAAVPHVNESRHGDWQEYYDDELLSYLRKKKFITEDCAHLGYKLL